MIALKSSSAGAPKKAFVVIPVHCRREVTLGCLHALQADGILGWAEIIVVDDGSTDGTGEAIQKYFPDVNLLPGDGGLWWTGAIVLGMEEAMRRQADVIVWLNDDCVPRPGSLATMVARTVEGGNISVGQVLSSAGGRYSGSNRTFFGLTPVTPSVGTVADCQTFPGNLVAIPRRVVEEIGYPDSGKFPQVFADIDYGLRAHARGFKILVLGDALADEVLILKPHATSWLLDDRPARHVLRAQFKRTANLNPQAYWHFSIRHWPVGGPFRFFFTYLKLFASLAVKTVVPRSWLIRLFGHRSVAWKTQIAAKDPTS